MKRLTDKDFRYVNAASTDIRKTIRREQARLAALKAEKPTPPTPSNVRKLVAK